MILVLSKMAEDKKGKNSVAEVRAHLQKLEVLNDIYQDFTKKKYPGKEERDIAKLKMTLVKKEIMLLNYLIEKEIDNISS